MGYCGQGDFAIALRISSHWNQLLHYIETGDNYINEAHTPLWSNFEKSLLTMGQAIFECGPNILEKRELEATSYTYYNEYLQGQLANMIFPNPLPNIPDPSEDLLIPSGKNIPCTGIWEPVTSQKNNTNIWNLFKKSPVPTGPFPIEGTMAYLHGGSHAPKIDDDEEEDGVPTTWRLLWKDDRYEDGTIPEEEHSYVFRLPETSAAPAPATTAPYDLLNLLSGQRAPVAGRWLLEGDLNVVVTLDKDAELPEHQGRAVRWILAIA